MKTSIAVVITPEQALMVLATGHELGLSSMQSIRAWIRGTRANRGGSK